MTKHIILSGLFILFAFGTTVAQQPTDTDSHAMPLTVDGLFDHIETGSRGIRTAKTAVDVSQYDIETSRAQRLPDLNLSISASYIGNALLTDRDFGHAQGMSSPHFGNSLALEAQQVVYSGGAITAGIRLAEFGKRQAETGLRLTRQQTRFIALGQYLDLYKTDNCIRVYERNIALTCQLIDNIRSQQQQGMALKNDITRYELQLEQLRLQLKKLHDTRGILNHQLCNTLDLPVNTTILPDTTIATKSCPQEGESYWQDQASANSPILEQNQLNIHISKQKEKIAKSDLLPKVALVAANNFNGPITFELPPIDKNLNIWYVGLGVSYNIGALYKSNKRVRQTSAETLKAQQSYALAQEEMDNRVNQAYVEYLQSYTELETQIKSVQLAKQNYEVVNARYLGQLALVTDMIDASNIHLNAELQEVAARINIVYAYYRVKYMAGDI